MNPKEPSNSSIKQALDILSKLAPTIYHDFASPAIQNLGKTLATVTDLLNTVLTPLEITNEVVRHHKERFLKQVAEQYSKIPEEQVCEPEIAIIGPIIENTKYKITQEYLREKYAKLVAAASNLEHCAKPLLSFNSVLDQLSPYETQFLESLFKDGDAPLQDIYFPIADIKLHRERGYTYASKNLIPVPSDFDDSVNALLISSFERLGIINVDKSTYLKPLEENYSYVSESEYFLNLCRIAEKERQCTGNSWPNYEIAPGVLSLTHFGVSFIQTVVF